MKTILILVLTGLGLIILIFGCATATGPLFNEVPLEEHKGKAIVYFYRNSHAGGAYTFDLNINEGKALPLQNKGYHMLVLDPGAYVFAVSYNSKLHAKSTFALQGGESYYIQYKADVVGYNPGFVTSNPIINYSITSVPRDEAMEVLKNCRLIEFK